jgi:hypothetical protein
MGASASIQQIPEDLKNKVLNNLRICRNETGQTRINALVDLWNIAFEDKNRIPLADPVVNYIPTMVYVLENALNDATAIEKCTGSIWCLSSEPSVRKILGSREMRLIPALMGAFRLGGAPRTNATNILMNISLERGVHDYLLSPEFGYMDTLIGELRSAPDTPIHYNSFQCLFTDIEGRFVPRAIELGLHTFLMNKLESYGRTPSNWGEIPKRCCNILMYMSRFSVGSEAICKLGKADFLYSLLADQTVQGIKVCFLVANCYGRDEGNSKMKSLLEDRPDVLKLTRMCFTVIIKYDTNSAVYTTLKDKGFVIGVIPLNIISSALKNMSLSDKNKGIMVKDSELIVDILVSIQAFIDNRPQFGGVYDTMFRPAGGGGEDYFSLDNFLELLVQLSFLYEDDTALKNNFNNFGGYQISSMMDKLMNLPRERNLSYEAKQFISQLHARYYPKPKVVEIPVATAVNTSLVSSSVGATSSTTNLKPPRHIMLSYAWGAKKDHVIALGKKLRALGYDVWRDEEGSTVVNAMSGDIVETMADAIQYSHMVVVCVSPQYKDSANCRAEAKYARAREQSHGLKMVYVMMDENYHTKSSPRVVDGWLGFMVGTELWYRLWDASFVDETAKCIVDLVGPNNGLIANNLAYLKAQQAPSANQSSQNNTSSQDNVPLPMTKAATAPPAPANKPTTSGTPNATAAWPSIDAKKAKYSTGMQGLIEDLGLEKAEDLAALDVIDWTLVSFMMKKPQQKVFYEALTLTVPSYEVGGSPNFEAAWTQVSSGKKAKYPEALKGILEDLGVEKGGDLSSLDGCDLAMIALTLKKPQQKPFLDALQMDLDD